MGTPRSRVVRSSATLVGVFAVGAAFAWFVWVPGHRPELRAGESYGIDVSHHQGAIQWHRVAADDISFAYIKASEGATFVDPRFHTNWAEAGDAGLDRGAYHFFSLCSSGAAQAANFLKVVPGRLELPPAVDLEMSPHCRVRPDAAIVRSELEVFIERVEQDLTSETILYVGGDFEAAYPIVMSVDRPRWRLRFLLRPEDDWSVWQVGSYSHVGGITGPVGLDVMSRSA